MILRQHTMTIDPPPGDPDLLPGEKIGIKNAEKIAHLLVHHHPPVVGVLRIPPVKVDSLG